MGVGSIILCVLACIVGLIVLLLSVPIKVNLMVGEKINLAVKYMFFKFELLPFGKKKPKEEKEEKPKEEKPKEEKPKEKKPKKEKKPNPLVESIKAMDTDDRDQIIHNLGHVLSLFGKKFLNSIVFDEFDIYVKVGSGDAASTAIKYGKLCQQIYPAAGYICANNKVGKYDIVIEPDFLAKSTEAEVYIDLSITVRKIINSVIGLVFRLLFSVILKFVMAIKSTKTDEKSEKPKKKAKSKK